MLIEKRPRGAGPYHILIDENKDQWFSFTINTKESWVIVRVREMMVFQGPGLVS